MGKPASRRAPKSRKAAPSPAVASVSKPPGLKVLFVSSEVTPFAKTGGLADVVGALPKALHELGIDVRVPAQAVQHLVNRAQRAFPRVREVLLVRGDELRLEEPFGTEAADQRCQENEQLVLLARQRPCCVTCHIPPDVKSAE